MAVSLTPKFNRQQIAQAIKERKKRIEEAILLRLQRVGEQFVNNARRNANFKDRTGNLRSSIGYVILKDGVQLFDNFAQRAGGPQGEQVAKDLVEEVKKNFPTGFVLIGVAGMDYAAAVESKGFDVITTSADIAEVSIKAGMQQLANKLK
jgi:hypothetical protein